MSTTTISGGTVATTTCAQARIRRERPVTRRLADVMAPVQGTTLPAARPSATKRQIAVPAGAGLGIAPAATAFPNIYMDVPPFRTGRPPV